MTRLQGFTLAIVAVTLGVMAFIEIIPIAHVVQVAMLAVFAVVSIFASMVFFWCALWGRD